MQNSEDIQQAIIHDNYSLGCGLMQNSEDIQHKKGLEWVHFVVV